MAGPEQLPEGHERVEAIAVRKGRLLEALATECACFHLGLVVVIPGAARRLRERVLDSELRLHFLGRFIEPVEPPLLGERVGGAVVVCVGPQQPLRSVCGVCGEGWSGGQTWGHDDPLEDGNRTHG